MNEHTNDPVPEPVHELIKVFKEKLPSVAFPDVSLQIIEALAEEVRSAENAVRENRARLEEAERKFTVETGELMQKCARGLAYAKVYAEGQEELMKRLSSISFGKSSRASKRQPAERTEAEDEPSPRERKKRSPAVAAKETGEEE